MRLPFLLAAFLAGAVHAAPAELSSVAICEDENEWPPYSYYERIEGRRSEHVIGYAADVISEILQHHAIGLHIDLIPWGRCLAVAALGKQYQLTLNMTWSEERGRQFLYSRPYYSMSNYYFYSRHHHPKGLPITGAHELHRYRACGVRGYNYMTYGFRPGEVDQGAKDFDAMIAKLHAGRCDLFVERLEVMQGYTTIGRDYLSDPELGAAAIPGMPPTQFHISVSRKAPNAQILLDLIDTELIKMEESGRLKALWRKSR